MEYRRDIDGLRAIAVLSVMLFHAKVPGFDGGFVGVDMFYVLSGFLITGIISGELETGHFSILNFYERRVRRIIPALVFILAVSIALFFPFMLPDDLENFGQSVVATIAFANNILLWLTSGYFEQSVDLKPMAHTWSLGVEEQYYVIVPLIMIAAYRLGGRRGVIGSIVAISLASLVFALFVSRIDQNLNFYLITSRFWELGAGSAAAFAYRHGKLEVDQWVSNALSSLGLLAILLSIMIFGGRQSNPDEMTLIPIIGTCLVILFSKPGTWVSPILSSRPAVAIGLISYSLYLWHQPLYVFVRLTSLEEPTAWAYLPYSALAFLLAYLSWRYVERPFRDRKLMTRTRVFVVSALGSALVFSAGLSFHLTAGFYDRWPELASDRNFGANQNIAFNLAPQKVANRALPTETEKRNVLVIGNSFARDVINLLQADPDLSKLNYSYSEVADCDHASIRSKTLPLAARARFVIFGSGVDASTITCVKRNIELLGGADKHDFLVFGTKNFGWNNNAIMLIDAKERYAYRTKVRPGIVESNRHGKAAFAATDYVDILGALGMGAEGRVPVFTPDHKFISQDREHLTEAGARYLATLVRDHPALAEMRKAATLAAP